MAKKTTKKTTEKVEKKAACVGIHCPKSVVNAYEDLKDFCGKKKPARGVLKAGKTVYTLGFKLRKPTAAEAKEYGILKYEENDLGGVCYTCAALAKAKTLHKELCSDECDMKDINLLGVDDNFPDGGYTVL